MTKTIRIMLIEDDPGDAGLVLEALRAVGTRATITHTKTLRDAQAWLATHECDVILADLSLPDSQGFPTITALQKTAPTLPVIVLSGNDDFDFAVRAVQAGTQDFLVKGEVDGAAIHRSILYAIQRKQLEEDLRKARDAAEASTRAKAHFLAVMSHEIRTPMNGILGLSYLLLKDKLSPDQHEQVQLIRESASSLLTILNDILDFSKLEADRMEVQSAPFDVRRVIGEIIALLRVRAREKGIGLDWTVAPEVPHQLVGDSGRVRQLLLNLIGNAVKFTASGGVTVSALVVPGPNCPEPNSPEPNSPGSLTVRFEVRDSGIGIEPGVVPTLFTAFTQGDARVARRFGGTGLGLAICRKIVERLGGTIGVASDPGHGSLFWFQLDLQPTNLLPEAAVTTEALSDEPRAVSLSVLVADDNLINQVVARNFLEKAGHHVFVVADGQQAVAAVGDGAFDVVLMDVQMPVMDGLEATRRIRSLAGPVAHVPIIALTASAMVEEVQHCLDAGMDDHLSKPLDPVALATMLEKRCFSDAPSQPLPTEPSPDQQAVLDASKIAKIVETIGKVDLSTMLQGLTRQFEGIYRGLLQIDASGDSVHAAKIVHELKGMVSNFGMTQLMRTLTSVEIHYCNGNLTEARCHLPVIKEQFSSGLAMLWRCVL